MCNYLKLRFFFVLYLISLNISARTTYLHDCDTLLKDKGKMHQLSLSIPDTLKIKNTETSVGQPKDHNMPWIVALIIGGLSVVVNFLVAYWQRKSSEKSLRAQMDNTRDVAEVQMKSSKEITITQLKATMAIKNRQAWVNELRETISEYLTCTIKVTPDSTLSDEEKKQYHHKIFYTNFKIRMMTNPKKKEQKKLLETVEKILLVITKTRADFKLADIQNAREECLSAANDLFENQWIKIKDFS